MMRSVLETGADAVAAGFSRDFMGCVKQVSNGISSGIYKDGSLEAMKSRMISNGAFFRYGMTTYLWNKVFSRELVEPCQMNADERISIGEDAAVTFPALEAARCVAVINSHSYHYRQREDSMLKGHEGVSAELEKVEILGDYLRKALKTSQARKQAKEFILANKIMRSGGARIGGYLPFDADLKGKRVAIALAGTFGQMIKRYADESGEFEVVGWVDDDYWEYRRLGMDVDPFEKIAEMDFDYAVVAKIDPEEREKVKDKLLKIKSANNKVLTIQSGMLK